ncbi:hypothetical protein [Glaciimonas sp. PCH181]|uniref:hypothetical protein n=1 Tax=Glaciimonas sp. PCH181 TaxID=2133943 RepID=UPI000D363B63|nr:hypothetical protein [Glaciimonas sp. PCH181]PUA18213.1 hypothetical protein C7W93_20630 [Glaciimonas sp. PCH181]
MDTFLGFQINNYPQNNNPVGTVDIQEIASVIWQSKRIILLIATIVTSLAVLFGWAISSYKSEGYFQMEMSFADFKRLQTAISAPARWQDFAKTLNKEQLATIREENFRSPRQLASLIEPIYPVTRSEMKDIPNTALKNEGADISGLKISYHAATPMLAQQGVLVLGDFLRDTVILLNYRDVVRKRYTDHRGFAQKFDNDAITARYDLEQLKIKKASMQSILREYPDSARLENRQPVTITDGNERFLSPVTQLVAIETDIADKGRDLPRIIRDQKINTINLRYYEQLQDFLNKSTSGNTFLASLPTIKKALNLNQEDEIDRSVYNNISIDDLKAHALYVEKTSFIASPLLPQKATPGLLKSGSLGLILGLIIGSGLALIRYFVSKPKILPSPQPAVELTIEKVIPNLI